MKWGDILGYGVELPLNAFNQPAVPVGLSGNQYTFETVAALQNNGLIGSKGLIVMGQDWATTGNFITSTTPNGPRWIYQGDLTWFSSGNGCFAYIDSSGRLFTWGTAGNTGLGRTIVGTNYNVPTQVGSATNWRSVSCGAGFMIGTQTDGTLWSWGANANGKTGQGTTSGTTTTPTKVGVATNWSTMHSAGDDFAMCVDNLNNLFSWGIATCIGTGNVQKSVPFNLSLSLGTITKIHSNYVATALIAGGSLYTTGNNINWMTGVGTNTGTTTTFTQIDANTDWTDAVIGVYANGGIRSGTTGYWGWGTGSGRAFGFSATAASYATPTQFNSSVGTYTRINCTGGGTTIAGTTVVLNDGTLVLNGTGNCVGLTPVNPTTQNTTVIQLPTSTKWHCNTDAVFIVLV